LKLIEDKLWYPHGCITDDVAGVIHHSMFLLFIQVSRGIPGQSLRGQVQSQLVMAIKFIDSCTPYIKHQSYPPQS
jgi:hypothetical protein